MRAVHRIYSKDGFFKKVVGVIGGGMQLFPILIVPSCMLLWWYLHKINRMDLFIPSLTHLTNIIPILLSFVNYVFKLVIVGFPLLVYFILPSDKNISAQRNAMCFIALVFLSICVYFFTLMFFQKYEIPRVFNMPLLCVLFPCVFLSISLMTFTLIKGNGDLCNQLFFKGSIILIVFLSLLLIYHSFRHLIIYSEGYSFAAFILMNLYFIWFVVSAYSPVLYFVYKKQSGGEINEAIVLGLLPVVLLAPSFAVPSVAFRMLTETMISIGVVDWNTHVYHIDSTKYSQDMFPELFWQTKVDADGGKGFFIWATRPFYLGDASLLCPKELTEPVNELLINKFGDDPDTRKSVEKKTRRMFQKCFVFESELAKQSDSTFSKSLDSK